MSRWKWHYVWDDISDRPWYEENERFEVVVDPQPLETVVLPLHRAYRALAAVDAGFYCVAGLGKAVKALFPCRDRMEVVGEAPFAAVLDNIASLGVKSCFREHAGHVCLARREHEAMVATLVTQEYRTLGLTVHPTVGRYYVPHETEHRFFEPGTSTIPGAGLGLFLRQGRLLRGGTIVAEYAGSPVNKPQKGQEHYAVRLSSGKFVCGLNAEHELAHLAALANDNGKDANCQLHEFEELPERVFLVATRDLLPGEEVFIRYGAQYWGAQSYKVLDRKAKGTTSKAANGTRNVAVDPDTTLLLKVFCRQCRNLVDRRIAALHKRECGDADAQVPLPFEDLNCLPFNQFTFVERKTRGARESLSESRHRAVYFVSNARFTQCFSHEAIADGSSDEESPTDRTSIAKRTRRQMRRG
jgi:hypothetical protein